MNQELSDTEKERLVERIIQAVGRVPFRAGRFDMKRYALPFYKNAYDVYVKCFTTRPVITKEYVCDDEHVFETDGEEETLIKINRALSLELDSENVAAYAAFYFKQVAVNDSFAVLALTPDDIIGEDFDEELRETLKNLISAPRVRKTESGFIVSGFILLEDTLFKADLKIEKKGAVSIDNEKIIYENLPVQRVILR